MSFLYMYVSVLLSGRLCAFISWNISLSCVLKIWYNSIFRSECLILGYVICIYISNSHCLSIGFANIDKTNIYVRSPERVLIFIYM